MEKLHAIAKRPAAVVVLLLFLGVTTHASAILISTFTNRDAFQAALSAPSLLFNFDNLADTGVLKELTVDGLTITGDFRIDHGAWNFSAPSSSPIGLAFNFGAANRFAFGADIAPLVGTGLINFSVGGLSALYNVTSPGFVGFITPFPFQAINATFYPASLTGGSMNFLIDNVVTNAVPEPSTLLLLVTGAGLVGLSRRRKRADGDTEGGQTEADSGSM